MKPTPPRKRHHKARRHFTVRFRFILVLLAALFEVAVIYWTARTAPSPAPAVDLFAPAPSPTPKAGDVLGVDAVEKFTPAQTAALIRHDYPAGVPGETTPITKITFHYQSRLPSGQLITEYGRAYLPDNQHSGLPVFAFAPGTTGIGDQCASSLEQPAKANWGTYDAHLAAYAVQGYAAVTTDYEGMRDPNRLHHYMAGELEGRALLDSVRALRRLPQARGRVNPTAGKVIVGGYSQGGHAAFWADKIASGYAPDIKILGVVGFGPVMSVKQTLTDITRGANIVWFGPNVLVSYEDYYGEQYPGVILPVHLDNLKAKVLAHCIDTDLSYWGHNPSATYTPEFIAAALTGDLSAAFPQLNARLDANAVGTDPTASAKRINGGDLDNVVLPAQQAAAFPLLCASSTGPVGYYVYHGATHYDTMLRSFGDTTAWMKSLVNGETVPSTCPH